MTTEGHRPLHESTAFRLTVLGTHLAHDFADHLRAVDLTTKHLGALTMLDQGLARTQDDIAGLMRVSPSLVARIADHLERHGLIERHRDPANRRRHVVSVTAQGRAVLDDAAAFAAAVDADLTSSLGQRLDARLDDALTGLMRQLSEGHRP